MRLVGLLLLAVVSPVLATPSDGQFVAATKIVDNGPDADRLTLVLVSDGYRDAELGAFAAQAQQFVDALFATPPFDRVCSGINVWRVDVSSVDSGADDPAACGGTGATPRTYFDASYCGDGVIRRLLVANGNTVTTLLNAQVPGWDQAIVIVNSTIHGGSGGKIGVTAVGGGWEDTALHEMGHSVFGLADEYEYWAGCSVVENPSRDHHPAAEPVEPNVTVETDPTLVKWRDLISPGTPLPTTANADCSQCDPQGDPYPNHTVVGLYEGAHYYHCDAWRPAFTCEMRILGSPFCPVCARAVQAKLAPYRPADPRCPVCRFDVDGDGQPDLELEDTDGDGFCEWPEHKTDLRGVLRFARDMQVAFTGNTVVEADRIVVEDGAVLRGDPGQLRSLVMVGRYGGVSSAGILDLQASDDLTIRASKGGIDLNGITRLAAGDRLALDARTGALVITPPIVDPAGFTLFGRNRVDVTARSADGSVKLERVTVGARAIRIDDSANLSVVATKEMHVGADVVLTTSSARTGVAASASNVVLRTTGRLVIGDGAVVDSGRNIQLDTRGADANVCLVNGPVLQAMGATGRPGRLYTSTVRGGVYDDGTATVRAIVVGPAITAGPCP